MKALKTRLRSNELTIGTWLTIGHPAIVEILASAGFDWLTIDMEHSAIELTAAMYLIPVIQGCGMDALVRVSKNEEVTIKRVLDIGADGIIVPMVNSIQDARRAVEYAKYPTLGKRGAGLYRAQRYGTHFDEYAQWVKDELVIIAQIEHIDAVNNLGEILDHPDIDGTLVGPYDLSASLGMPGDFEQVEVTNAIEQIEHMCKEQNKPLGFHVISANGSELRRRIDYGYTFLAFSLDSLFLGSKVRAEMQEFKHGNHE